MVGGLLKLVYPDGEFSKEQLEEILKLALEMRRRVKEQLKKLGVKDTLNPAFVPSSGNQAEQKEAAKQPKAQPEATPVPVTDNSQSEKATTSLFSEFETEKPKEEVPDLTPRPYHRTPEMHLREGSLVANRARDIGYLKDITPYGATFQPLDLKGYQKEKALLYAVSYTHLTLPTILLV